MNGDATAVNTAGGKEKEPLESTPLEKGKGKSTEPTREMGMEEDDDDDDEEDEDYNEEPVSSVLSMPFDPALTDIC